MTQDDPTAAAPASHHNVPGIAWAALDAPDGDLVKVPQDRLQALQWRARSRFFCPVGSASGCGRPLELTAGLVVTHNLDTGSRWQRVAH